MKINLPVYYEVTDAVFAVDILPCPVPLKVFSYIGYQRSLKL